MRLMLLSFILFSIIVLSKQNVFPVGGKNQYSLSYWQALAKCSSIGASLATVTELENARKNGFEHCSCGWLADKTARYPMNKALHTCGGKPGIHKCEWSDTWDAFCYVGDVLGNCSSPLGMETGYIENHQLTSTSSYHTFWNERWGAHLARINRQGTVNAWMPHDDGRNQYIQVDLVKPMAISGILTQGVKRYLKQQYVTKFTISTSKDGEFWLDLLDEKTETKKIFSGNSDNNGQVRNMFDRPVVGRYIRIYPYTWYRHISLRFELYGCSLDVYDETMERMRDTGVVINESR